MKAIQEAFKANSVCVDTDDDASACGQEVLAVKAKKTVTFKEVDASDAAKDVSTAMNECREYIEPVGSSLVMSDAFVCEWTAHCI